MIFQIEIGDTVSAIEAADPEEAVRRVYAKALNAAQLTTLEIESNLWSGDDWNVAVTASDGQSEFFFVSFDQDA